MIKKLLPKGTFYRDILTLMTGTSIAQAVPILLSPVLTRIYSPDDFGLFALYMAIVAVLSIVATGRFELAIMLPKTDNDAVNVVFLIGAISIIFSGFLFATVLIFNDSIAQILGNPEIKSWLYCVPLSVFLTGVYQGLNYWSNRKRHFKRLAISRVVQSSSTGVGQLGLGGLQSGSIGLVFGGLFGQTAAAAILGRLLWMEDKGYLPDVNWAKMKSLFARYINFPKIDVPTTALNVGAVQAPNMLLPLFFGPGYAGYFYLTQRVLQAPITLISTSVLDVFKEEASKNYREKGHAKEIFIKTFKWLVLMAGLPSIILFFFIEDVFIVAFGSEWVVAGEYARIMLPALVLRFIANPLSFMIYIAEKQIVNLVTMVILFAAVVASFYIASDHYQVISMVSFIYSCYYVTHLIMSARYARVI